MHFIFEDRVITHTPGSSSAPTLSMKFCDVFIKDESGNRGDYIGTLQNLRPEPASQDVRDYRFFDIHGSQRTTSFKENHFFEDTSFARAKEMLAEALSSSLPQSGGGYAIVKVLLEGVDPRVPNYLHYDRDHGIWSIHVSPELVPADQLKDMKKVFYDVRQRESWYDIKDLIVRHITPDMF